MLDDPEDVAPSRCNTFLHYTWKVCSCVFSHVILVSLVVSYCIMGAFTFQSLEKNNEIKVRFFRFFPPLNFCVSRSGKWPNRGEADCEPPYNADVQKGWWFFSVHSYVCVMWCFLLCTKEVHTHTHTHTHTHRWLWEFYLAHACFWLKQLCSKYRFVRVWATLLQGTGIWYLKLMCYCKLHQKKRFDLYKCCLLYVHS
jgi:hypothetical protein